TTGLANDPTGTFLQNGLGTLDANGRAVASFQAPPGLLAPLIGGSVTWSAISGSIFTSPVLPAFTAEAKTMPIL
ncbi:MAG: hypothetical protein RIT25_986, partial [Planctomycetota bacterium]